MSLSPSDAAVVNPDVGAFSSFTWNDASASARKAIAPKNEWSVTVDVDSTISFFVRAPFFGDSFGLSLNGVATEWTKQTQAGRHMARADVTLIAGVEYIFAVDVLTDRKRKPNLGFVAFSAASPIAAVPLPAAGMALLGGLGMMAALRRRSA